MADNGGAAGGQGATGTNGTGTQGAQGAAGGSYVVQNGGGAAGTSGQGAAGTGGVSGYDSGRSARVSELAERLIHRHGGAERALDVLAGDNFDLREARRVQDEQLASLRTQLPPNGAMVLVGDDVAQFQAFKALNLPADKVKEQLTEYTRLAAERQTQAGQTLNQQAAAAAGYTTPDVLGDLVTARGLQIEMRDTMVQANGKTETKRMPFVRKASDPNGHFTPLAEWVSGNAASYLPALTAKVQGTGGQAGAGQSGTSGQGAAGTSQQTAATGATGAQGAQGTVVVMSGDSAGAGDQGGALDPVSARIAANKKAAQEGTNPLRAKAGAK